MTFVFIDREKNRDQRSGIQIFRDLENISMIKHYKSDAKKVIPKKIPPKEIPLTKQQILRIGGIEKQGNSRKI